MSIGSGVSTSVEALNSTLDRIILEGSSFSRHRDDDVSEIESAAELETDDEDIILPPSPAISPKRKETPKRRKPLPKIETAPKHQAFEPLLSDPDHLQSHDALLEQYRKAYKLIAVYPKLVHKLEERVEGQRSKLVKLMDVDLQRRIEALSQADQEMVQSSQAKEWQEHYFRTRSLYEQAVDSNQLYKTANSALQEELDIVKDQLSTEREQRTLWEIQNRKLEEEKIDLRDTINQHVATINRQQEEIAQLTRDLGRGLATSIYETESPLKTPERAAIVPTQDKIGSLSPAVTPSHAYTEKINKMMILTKTELEDSQRSAVESRQQLKQIMRRLQLEFDKEKDDFAAQLLELRTENRQLKIAIKELSKGSQVALSDESTFQSLLQPDPELFS